MPQFSIFSSPTFHDLFGAEMPAHCNQVINYAAEALDLCVDYPRHEFKISPHITINSRQNDSTFNGSPFNMSFIG